MSSTHYRTRRDGAMWAVTYDAKSQPTAARLATVPHRIKARNGRLHILLTVGDADKLRRRLAELERQRAYIQAARRESAA